MTAYDGATLSGGIDRRTVANGNGLQMHILEAGAGAGRPLVVLLHGFPELAYSWRHVMLPLAEAGFHVVAPDQRGYGLTTGWDGSFDGELASYRLVNLVRDVMGLTAALGRDHVDCVVGHDFGSPVAGSCALMRPDIFRSVVMMSAPYNTPGQLGDVFVPREHDGADVHAEMAALDRPRKHYQWYYSTREADRDMLEAPQGLHDFLRAYYHVKSADWAANKPYPLARWTAEALAQLPTYYVMDLADTMPAAVAPHMPSAEQVAACGWLTDAELGVYRRAFESTGFQGALNWYRCRTSGLNAPDLALFAGRRIEVPAMFVAGASDWGIRQTPGALEQLCERDCVNFRGCELIPDAGHWVQQEKPEAVSNTLLGFLRSI